MGATFARSQFVRKNAGQSAGPSSGISWVSDLRSKRQGVRTNMEVIIAATAGGAGAVVADLMRRLLRDRPAASIGLATGSSPLVV